MGAGTQTIVTGAKQPPGTLLWRFSVRPNADRLSGDILPLPAPEANESVKKCPALDSAPPSKLAVQGVLASMADPQIMTLVTVVIAVGFAVTIPRSNRMRSFGCRNFCGWIRAECGSPKFDSATRQSGHAGRAKSQTSVARETSHAGSAKSRKLVF